MGGILCTSLVAAENDVEVLISEDVLVAKQMLHNTDFCGKFYKHLAAVSGYRYALALNLYHGFLLRANPQREASLNYLVGRSYKQAHVTVTNMTLRVNFPGKHTKAEETLDLMIGDIIGAAIPASCDGSTSPSKTHAYSFQFNIRGEKPIVFAAESEAEALTWLLLLNGISSLYYSFGFLAEGLQVGLPSLSFCAVLFCFVLVFFWFFIFQSFNLFV